MMWLLRSLTVLTRLYFVLCCDSPPGTMGAALEALAACIGLQQLELVHGEVCAGAESASCAAFKAADLLDQVPHNACAVPGSGARQPPSCFAHY